MTGDDDLTAWVPRLRRYARALAGNRDDADDLVQDTLERAWTRARRRASWFRRPALAAAAAVVLVLTAGGAGWGLRGARDGALLAAATPLSGDAFATRAAIAHAVYVPEVRRRVEVDGAHEDQLVTWLSKRLGAPMKAPHLQSLGYALEGGRLLPGERGPVAQFMYRDEAGHRLTLYVSSEQPVGAAVGLAHADLRGHDTPRADTAFRFVSEGQVNVFTWRDGPFHYAITAAAADRAALTRVSAEVYRQLEEARP